eukprot:m.89740 g.89740  ORF g.89740 m.89740 type:complete len:625 (-) comp13237_c0_seq2:101-1975(-)
MIPSSTMASKTAPTRNKASYSHWTKKKLGSTSISSITKRQGSQSFVQFSSKPNEYFPSKSIDLSSFSKRQERRQGQSRLGYNDINHRSIMGITGQDDVMQGFATMLGLLSRPDTDFGSKEMIHEILVRIPEAVEDNDGHRLSLLESDIISSLKQLVVKNNKTSTLAIKSLVSLISSNLSVRLQFHEAGGINILINAMTHADNETAFVASEAIADFCQSGPESVQLYIMKEAVGILSSNLNVADKKTATQAVRSLSFLAQSHESFRRQLLLTNVPQRLADLLVASPPMQAQAEKCLLVLAQTDLLFLVFEKLREVQNQVEIARHTQADEIACELEDAKRRQAATKDALIKACSDLSTTKKEMKTMQQELEETKASISKMQETLQMEREKHEMANKSLQDQLEEAKEQLTFQKIEASINLEVELEALKATFAENYQGTSNSNPKTQNSTSWPTLSIPDPIDNRSCSRATYTVNDSLDDSTDAKVNITPTKQPITKDSSIVVTNSTPVTPHSGCRAKTIDIVTPQSGRRTRAINDTLEKIRDQTKSPVGIAPLSNTPITTPTQASRPKKEEIRSSTENTPSKSNPSMTSSQLEQQIIKTSQPKPQKKHNTTRIKRPLGVISNLKTFG